MPSTNSQPIARTELEPALRRIVARNFEKNRRIREWHRRVSPYSSSCTVTRIRLKLTGRGRGHGFQMALKDLTPGSQLPTARRVRPGFLYDPDRELAAYEHILNPLNLGTARFFGAEISTDPPRRWLFLEWVHGPLLWQMGRLHHWQQAAVWLARFHHEVSRLPGLGRSLRLVRPLRYDHRAYTHWVERAESVLRDTLLRQDRSAAKRFSRVVRRYDRVIENLCRAPQTLVHGEFYPANVLMRWTGQHHRPCPIDWELTGWATGVLDLAALCAGEWDVADKRKIIQAYHSACSDYRDRRPGLPELNESVMCAQLHLCFRQLGWAVRWRPQGQTDRAWLAQALDLADQLGL